MGGSVSRCAAIADVHLLSLHTGWLPAIEALALLNDERLPCDVVAIILRSLTVRDLLALALVGALTQKSWQQQQQQQPRPLRV